MEFDEFVNVRSPDEPPLYVKAGCVARICAQAQGPGATIGLTNGEAFMSRDTAEEIMKRVALALRRLDYRRRTDDAYAAGLAAVKACTGGTIN